MAGLTTIEGFSSRYSSAVRSNTDQQLLGSDCSPLLQKVCLNGEPRGTLNDEQDKLMQGYPPSPVEPHEQSF